MTHMAFGATDVGRRRASNEDHLLLDHEIGVYAVADGMGGHAAGEIASEIAITTLGKSLRREGWPESTRGNGGAGLKQEIARTMRIAIAEANSEICNSVKDRVEWQGMGTTLVAIALVEGSAIIGHVGDSRAYLYRDGTLSRLTSDHSWVNEQVKLGLLSPEEAQRHPWRNIVTRALGNRAEVDVDIQEKPAASGDLFLLCSDGLNTMLKDSEIEAILKDSSDHSETICKLLIDAANEQGGEDNITVVTLWVE